MVRTNRWNPLFKEKRHASQLDAVLAAGVLAGLC